MNKSKIIAIVAIVLFAVSLFGCGNVVDNPEPEDVVMLQTDTANEDEKVSDSSTQDTQEQVAVQENTKPDEEEQQPEDIGQTATLTEEETTQEPPSEDIQTQETNTDEDKVCTLYVNCKDVLQNYDMLKENKKSVIPQNGVIYEEKSVTFSEGESVFDILKREMEGSNIHLEFVYTPMYKSVYIEGIGNLYEFDCGDTSGWSYRVNGIKPNYGCSQYIVKIGDKIEFYYSCSF